MPHRSVRARTRALDASSLFNAMTEAPRLLLEASQLYLDWRALAQKLAPGDGHAVLILPGFAGNDASTLALRRLLAQIGYRTLPWEQGTNTGNPGVLKRVVRQTAALHRATGCRVSLVGQSLGGVFAQEVARELPDAVRCVIGLGSPFATHRTAKATPSGGRRWASAVRRLRRVPTTAIYSKGDGVVPWQDCMVRESHWTENIETRGSHTGMAHNPDVIRIVADRLAQRPESWRRYDPDQSPEAWQRAPLGLPDLHLLPALRA